MEDSTIAFAKIVLERSLLRSHRKKEDAIYVENLRRYHVSNLSAIVNVLVDAAELSFDWFC